jgi:hypothetical protein
VTGGVSPPFAPGSVLRASACFGKQQGQVDIEPEALARPGGLVNDAQGARTAAALLAVRQEGRGSRGSGEAKAAGTRRQPLGFWTWSPGAFARWSRNCRRFCSTSCLSLKGCRAPPGRRP